MTTIAFYLGLPLPSACFSGLMVSFTLEKNSEPTFRRKTNKTLFPRAILIFSLFFFGLMVSFTNKSNQPPRAKHSNTLFSQILYVMYLTHHVQLHECGKPVSPASRRKKPWRMWKMPWTVSFQERCSSCPQIWWNWPSRSLYNHSTQ